VAVVVAAAAVLVEEEGVVIEERADAEAWKAPCESRQRDVEEVGRSDQYAAVAGEGQ